MPALLTKYADRVLFGTDVLPLRGAIFPDLFPVPGDRR